MNKTGLLILALALATTACSRVAPNPQTVASEYWTQIQAGDTTAARELVSTSSRSKFDQQIKTLKPVQKFTLGNTHAVVSTTLNPSATSPANNQSFDTMLVLENGRWRVDANRTLLPADMDSSKQQQEKLADKLSKSIQTNLDEMDKTMREGAQLLNNALRDGSRDMEQSLLKGIKQLNESMQHSIEQLKRRRQQQNPPPGKFHPASPNVTNGEGVI